MSSKDTSDALVENSRSARNSTKGAVSAAAPTGAAGKVAGVLQFHRNEVTRLRRAVKCLQSCLEQELSVGRRKSKENELKRVLDRLERHSEYVKQLRRMSTYKRKAKSYYRTGKRAGLMQAAKMIRKNVDLWAPAESEDLSSL